MFQFIVYCLGFFFVFKVICFYVFLFHYFHLLKIHSSKNSIIFSQVLCFISSNFNTCHIFIGSISFMFYIHGFMFLKFFCSLSCKLIGGTSSEAPSSKSAKRIAIRINPPKPKLHAPLFIALEENLILMMTLLLFQKQH